MKTDKEKKLTNKINTMFQKLEETMIDDELDLTKPIMTRAGNAFRLYATDGGGRYPIHGACKVDNEWRQGAWTRMGSLFSDDYVSGLDLINVPE